MNVNGIGGSVPAVDMGGGSGSGASKIKALEQKLQRLTEEKKAAARNRDAEKEKKLEEEIQQVKRELQQLKQKEKKEEEEKKDKEGSPEESGAGGPIIEGSLTGVYLDRRA